MKYIKNIYDKNEVQKAIKEFENSNESFQKISDKYNIGISCLKYHYYERKKRLNKENKSETIKNKKISEKSEKSEKLEAKYVSQPGGSRKGSKSNLVGHPMYECLIPIENKKEKKVKKFDINEYIDPKTNKYI